MNDLEKINWWDENKLLKPDYKAICCRHPFGSTVNIQEEKSREHTSFSTEWVTIGIICQKREIIRRAECAVKIPLITQVFDHGLSYYNIKSSKIGLHLPFEWSAPYIQIIL